MNSWSSAIDGRMRLMARIFSNPSTPKDLALNTSAIPPTEMRSRSTYLPNGIGCRTRDATPQPTADTSEHSHRTAHKRTHSSEFVGQRPGGRGNVLADTGRKCLTWG